MSTDLLAAQKTKEAAGDLNAAIRAAASEGLQVRVTVEAQAHVGGVDVPGVRVQLLKPV